MLKVSSGKFYGDYFSSLRRLLSQRKLDFSNIMQIQQKKPANFYVGIRTRNCCGRTSIRIFCNTSFPFTATGLQLREQGNFTGIQFKNNTMSKKK